jgi:glycosyltransferase involved in cell wall biosynthesis
VDKSFPLNTELHLIRNINFLNDLKKFDIIHIHDRTPLIDLTIPITKRKIFTLHGIIPSHLCRPFTLLVKTSLLNYNAKYMCKFTDANIGVSECQSYYLRLWKVKNIHTIYNGIDPERFRILSKTEIVNGLQKYGIDPTEGPILLFVGSIQYIRGLEDAIRNMPYIFKKYPSCKFIIVGHSVGDYSKKLKALCKLLHIEKSVIFMNYIPNEDLPLFYNSCHILISPSLICQLPRCVIEAIACGKPVILRNNYCLDKNIFTNSGIAKFFSKPESIGNIVVKLLDTYNEQEYRVNATKFIKQFYWSNIIPKILQLYET